MVNFGVYWYLKLRIRLKVQSSRGMLVHNVTQCKLGICTRLFFILPTQWFISVQGFQSNLGITFFKQSCSRKYETWWTGESIDLTMCLQGIEMITLLAAGDRDFHRKPKLFFTSKKANPRFKLAVVYFSDTQ